MRPLSRALPPFLSRFCACDAHAATRSPGPFHDGFGPLSLVLCLLAQSFLKQQKKQ